MREPQQASRTAGNIIWSIIITLDFISAEQLDQPFIRVTLFRRFAHAFGQKEHREGRA
jgi:hypothetical protein